MHLLSLVLALLQGTLRIMGPGGTPVQGASICVDSSLVAISDLEGSAELPDITGTIRVSALGYASWTGVPPDDGFILLDPAPVPSGLVIDVSGSRRGLGELTPSTTVLGRRDLELLSLSGLRSLGGLSGGVSVREYGGAMSVASVSIRGSAAGQAGYSLDGHPMESCMDGLPAIMPDLSLFGALEVARGGGSGSLRNGMSGALNFIPEAPEAPDRGSVMLDDRGGIGASGAFGLGTGRTAVSLRRNVGSTGSTALSGSVLHTGGTGSTRFGLLATAAGGETEGPDWSLPTDGSRQVYSLEGWLRWRKGKIGLDADAGSRRVLYSSTVPVVVDGDHREGGGGLGMNWDPVSGPLDIRLSLNASGRVLRSSALGERRSLTGDFSLACGWEGPVILGASSRFSIAEGGEPMAGAVLTVVRPMFDSLLAVHLTGSTGFRRPTFNDLYWPEDPFAEGNPDLEPERSVEAEAGVELPGDGRWGISASGFLAVTDRLIRWEPGEEGRWRPVNIARVLRRGVEAEGWVHPGCIRLRAVLSLLSVRDDDLSSPDYGMELPYTPDYSFGVHMDARISDGLSVWASADGMGVRFLNYAGTSWLSAHALLSAGAEVLLPFMSSVELALSGSNLMGLEYEESNGYPGQPRTLMLAIRWTEDR